MILVPLTIVASAVLGWQDNITVQASRGDHTHTSFYRSLAGLDRPSERTLETLKRHDVEKRYGRDVEGAIASLEKVARSNPDADVVYALAELSWIEGNRLDRWRKAAAIDKYLDAVAYAFDFLFDVDLALGRQPSDPRFRLACDLYNGGLDRLIRAAEADGAIMPGGSITLKTPGRKQVLRVALRKSPWKAADVDQIILASDFKVTGLDTHSYHYGLGVPLIGLHKVEDSGKEGEARFYPPEMAFPLTAFIRPVSRLRDPATPIGEPRECTLDLVDPILVPRVGAPPSELPVESDFTTPLAYMWSRSDLKRYRWKGLIHPGAALGRANLMLLRPYEPNKIPVVMVHGLISTPLAWIPMINELLRDPIIQQRYQFMLYMYPTGVPIPIAAAGLRESLLKARQMYNPDGRDPAFDEMVLLGHSMGGLLSHEMALYSGDKFWQLNSDYRFDRIIGDSETLSELKRYLFFEPVPSVKRVVFLATPHRGSDYSHNVIGRVGSSLIGEVDHISDLLSKLIKDNPDAFARNFQRLPSSIETLNTNDKMLLALLAMQPNPKVRFHSIIGSERPGGVEDTTDGVVPYRSASLKGPEIESELIVRSGHGVQKSHGAINEVQRILWKHVGFMPAQTAANPAPGASPPVTVEPTERK